MRFGWMISLFAIFSFAIEVDLKPDTNSSIGYRDAQILKNYLYRTYRYRITDKGAYTIVKENRMLANAYLKRGLLSKKDREYLKIIAEKYLAESFIKNIQRQQKLSDKVLLSYYLDNRDEFKNEDKIHFILLKFPSFDRVVEFYRTAKQDKNIIEKAKNEYNVTVKDLGWKEFSALKPVAKSFIKKDKKDYFLPPFVFAPKKIDVLYVADYKKGKGYKSFNEVKEEIKQILYKKAFVKERNKILQQLENAHE